MESMNRLFFLSFPLSSSGKTFISGCYTHFLAGLGGNPGRKDDLKSGILEKARNRNPFLNGTQVREETIQRKPRYLSLPPETLLRANVVRMYVVHPKRDYSYTVYMSM